MSRQMVTFHSRPSSKILHRHFPTSRRVVIKRSLLWVLICGVMSAALLGRVVWGLPPEGKLTLELEFVHELLIGCAGVLVFAALVKVVYEELYRRSYQYIIKRGHLAIKKGVVIRHSGLFPLRRITDVYIERTWLDLVLGICSLHISTPTLHSEAFARIEGLSMRVAGELQKLLTAAIDKAVVPAPNRRAGHKVVEPNFLHAAARRGSGASVALAK